MSERYTGRMWPMPRAQEPHQTTVGYGRGLAELVEGKNQIGMEPDVSNRLTLFAEAFPASPIASPALAEVPATSATSGRSSPDSFASLDPDGSWRKTSQGYCQVTLDGSLARFSETWPAAGMTRNGRAYELPTLARPTSGTGYGWWLTPTVADSANRAFSINSRGEPKLSAQVKICPTPTARDYRSPGTPERLARARRESSRGQPLTEMIGGMLNPTWVEWLMGYPLGWTDLEGWATPSFRKLRNGSPNGSKTQKKGAK